MNPVRVTTAHPCPICGRSSWCMIGDRDVFCMRVTSTKTKEFKDGSVAYLHPVGKTAQNLSTRTQRKPVTLDVRTVLKEWGRFNRSGSMGLLAENLGVTLESLESLGCTKAPMHGTWAFPMSNGEGEFCGIRLRRDNGDKWAERGSHQGLFIPQVAFSPVILLCEGPTDTAAALSLGYSAVGRPNCCGGIEQIKTLVARLHVRMAVIVSDLDDAGLRGARTLQEHLPIATAILVLPSKDLRGAVRAGIDRATVDAMISQLIWRRP